MITRHSSRVGLKTPSTLSRQRSSTGSWTTVSCYRRTRTRRPNTAVCVHACSLPFILAPHYTRFGDHEEWDQNFNRQGPSPFLARRVYSSSKHWLPCSDICPTKERTQPKQRESAVRKGATFGQPQQRCAGNAEHRFPRKKQAVRDRASPIQCSSDSMFTDC